MGDNYYAAVKVSDNVTVTLHICKSYRMFEGTWFRSWEAWKSFLTAAEDKISIYRETSDVILSLDKFIKSVEAVDWKDRGRQTKWVKEHPDYDTGNDWWDKENYSFHRGEFF